MQNLLGLSLWFALPIVLGLLAIALPFWCYREKRNDGALTLGIINSVFCGLAVLTLAGTLAFDWYPTFLPHIVVGLGFLATVILVVKSDVQKKKEASVRFRNPEPMR